MLELLISVLLVIAVSMLVFYKIALWLERSAEREIESARFSYRWQTKPYSEEDVLEFTHKQVRAHYLHAIAERMTGFADKMKNKKFDLKGESQ